MRKGVNGLYDSVVPNKSSVIQSGFISSKNYFFVVYVTRKSILREKIMYVLSSCNLENGCIVIEILNALPYTRWVSSR